LAAYHGTHREAGTRDLAWCTVSVADARSAMPSHVGSMRTVGSSRRTIVKRRSGGEAGASVAGSTSAATTAVHSAYREPEPNVVGPSSSTSSDSGSGRP
jgi:hypothetical protein